VKKLLKCLKNKEQKLKDYLNKFFKNKSSQGYVVSLIIILALFLIIFFIFWVSPEKRIEILNSSTK